ncbi:MAG: hypothetical protein OEL89_00550 [Candidatus Peregrinibacteria bacterium]|nr:hypothetical protein [Candidatus Peregrinibacteria bacterium]
MAREWIETDEIKDKGDLLNGVDFSNSNETQQVFYIIFKEIEKLREVINLLEARIVKLEKIELK